MRAATLTRLLVIAACGFAVIGCKKDTGSTGGGVARHDPLFGNGRIPPQNVPVPDRGTATGNNKNRPFDPLMTPAGKDSKIGAAGYTEDPQRWKGGPWVPSDKSVPAALAGRTKDGEDLKIDDPKGVPLRPAGGVMPVGDADLAAAADVQLQQLRDYGVAQGNYSFSRENGQVVFRANVPNPTTGATQGFTGSGASSSEAVKQVLDQVKASRK